MSSVSVSKIAGLQRQWQELGLNWRSLWAESDGAFLEGPMVGFRAAAFGTWLRATEKGEEV